MTAPADTETETTDLAIINQDEIELSPADQVRLKGVVPIKTKQGLKPYQVAEGTIKDFRDDHPDWPVIYEELEDTEEVVKFTCTIMDEQGVVRAKTYAKEKVKGAFSDPYLTCQTTAYNRALRDLGYSTLSALTDLIQSGIVHVDASPLNTPEFGAALAEQGAPTMEPHYDVTPDSQSEAPPDSTPIPMDPKDAPDPTSNGTTFDKDKATKLYFVRVKDLFKTDEDRRRWQHRITMTETDKGVESVSDWEERHFQRAWLAVANRRKQYEKQLKANGENT